VGNCCWLCCTSDNTLHWVLLWAMRGFGQHTLLGIIRSDVGRLHQFNGLKTIFFLNNSRKVEVSVSVYWTEYPFTKTTTCRCFPVYEINRYEHATIRQISYSQLAPSPKPFRVKCISTAQTLSALLLIWKCLASSKLLPSNWLGPLNVINVKQYPVLRWVMNSSPSTKLRQVISSFKN
jgi:hypothetical protein